MEIKPFTEEELEILRKNPAVECVTPYFLHLTSEFKSWFYIEYQSGKMAPQILRDAGFDVNILGKSRVRSIRYHIVKDYKDAEQGKQCAKYPTENKLVYYAIRAGFTVLVMCPIMSLYSNVILMFQFHWTFGQLLSNWIPKMVVNWIFAYFVQILLLGPINRTVFGLLFPPKQTASST